ncbi:MAG: DUF3303 family protein [Chloroflexota bacterium]
MLFMITQVHSPESCSIDDGGSDVLIDKKVRDVTVKGRWGAYAEHTIWYLVEADSAGALHRFLAPGMKRCTSEVTPVHEEPITRRKRRQAKT